MQIPILSGVYADAVADWRTAYPRNLVPVPKAQGISKGFLRPADGIELLATGPGVDRGGIRWNDVCYRVMGDKLCRVNRDGTIDELGGTGGSGQVSIDYSFDRIGVASGGHLFYWDGTTLTQVTDPDIGTVIDALWVDGYWMTTDGTSIAVTELNDPTSVNPLKYGSSEADPDPVKALLKLRREVHVLNRFTIEVFENVGGTGFPFSRIEGAQVMKGAIGTHACALLSGGIAFLGSGRDESPAVWLAANGQADKLSTAEIDTLLQGYTEEQLAQAVMETRIDKGHQELRLHLPDQCLVYDLAATVAAGEPIWFTLDSGIVDLATYRARNLVWCYDRWVCGDPTSANVGTLTSEVSSHFGAVVGWSFGTLALYNDGRGLIMHALELVALTGRVAFGADPVIWMSYSDDGETWSLERPKAAGTQGQRGKRIAWRGLGEMQHYRMYRFRGTSDAHVSFARLEAEAEGLNG